MLHPLAAGSIFARDFRIVRLLGAGGMGAVYVAEQLSTGKQRALKLMQPQLVADASLRRRFEQEARIGARIESDHVVEVHAAGIDDDTQMPWLVMELLRGEDLGTYAQRRGKLPLNEVRAILEQLCHAMGAAHAAGIVHRDLKPENIFLAEARTTSSSRLVKVLDFGIAKLVAESGNVATTAMGSPLWMAPEQTEARALSPAADVWAIGLITFHLLTGLHLWRATDGEVTLPRLLRDVLFEPIPKASARAAERGLASCVPPGFDEWLGRCVVRDPSSRFADASQAFRALALLTEPAAHEATAYASPDIALASAREDAPEPTPAPPVAVKNATPKPRVKVVRTRKCPACGAENRGDAYKCARCKELFARRK